MRERVILKPNVQRTRRQVHNRPPVAQGRSPTANEHLSYGPSLSSYRGSRGTRRCPSPRWLTHTKAPGHRLSRCVHGDNAKPSSVGICRIPCPDHGSCGDHWRLNTRYGGAPSPPPPGIGRALWNCEADRKSEPVMDGAPAIGDVLMLRKKIRGGRKRRRGRKRAEKKESLPHR